MTQEEKEAAVDDVAFALKAIEPWLMQLLKFNPEEKYLEPVRRQTAEKLVELGEAIARR